jgi:hypothetical protein
MLRSKLPVSLLISVFPFVVWMAISLPVHLAITASLLQMVRLRLPRSSRISTFPLLVVMAINV